MQEDEYEAPSVTLAGLPVTSGTNRLTFGSELPKLTLSSKWADLGVTLPTTNLVGGLAANPELENLLTRQAESLLRLSGTIDAALAPATEALRVMSSAHLQFTVSESILQQVKGIEDFWRPVKDMQERLAGTMTFTTYPELSVFAQTAQPRFSAILPEVDFSTAIADAARLGIAPAQASATVAEPTQVQSRSESALARALKAGDWKLVVVLMTGSFWVSMTTTQAYVGSGMLAAQARFELSFALALNLVLAYVTIVQNGKRD